MVKNAINAAITVLVGLAGVFGCCCGMLFSVAAVVESVFSKIQKMVKAHLWVLLWHAFQRCGRRRISIFEDPEDGQGTSEEAAEEKGARLDRGEATMELDGGDEHRRCGAQGRGEEGRWRADPEGEEGLARAKSKDGEGSDQASKGCEAAREGCCIRWPHQGGCSTARG